MKCHPFSSCPLSVLLLILTAIFLPYVVSIMSSLLLLPFISPSLNPQLFTSFVMSLMSPLLLLLYVNTLTLPLLQFLNHQYNFYLLPSLPWLSVSSRRRHVGLSLPLYRRHA